MINLRGLYYYYRASKRIVVPLTKTGWKTLSYIAWTWKDNHPEQIQFGAYLALQLEEYMDERMCREALDLLVYQRSHTEKCIAGFSYFPSGPWVRIDGDYNELYGYKTMGWRQTYEWRQVC